MKENELKDLFDRTKPDDAAKEKMYNNILMHSEKGRFNMRFFSVKKAVPVLAMAVVIAGSLLAYNLLPNKPDSGLIKQEEHVTNEGNRVDDSNKQGSNYVADSDSAREDAIAPVLYQFRLNNKNYTLLDDYLRAEFGLPSDIAAEDIGDKIGTINDSPDKNLIGCELFKYKPAGGEEIVAVKTDDGYVLYKFFTFESYNNNQDEDADAYLKLYGINNAEDIAKVVFIRHSERSKLEGTLDITGEIAGSSEIAEFYNYYSVLKNSSDKYFDKLFNINKNSSSNGDVKDVEIDVNMNKNGSSNGDARDVETGVADPVPPDYIVLDEDLPADYDGTVSNAKDMPAYAEDKALVEQRDSISGSNASSAGGSDSIDPAKYDTGNTPGSVAPVEGPAGNALSNYVTIRIYNQKGIYYESPYYIDFGFISRYEIGEDFADFLSGYIK